MKRYLVGLLYEPPHHLLDVGPGLLGGVRVHGHPGHPSVEPAAARPADVQGRHLDVGHLGPVGGVDPGVRAGGLLGPLVLPGLGVAVRLVLPERLAQDSDLPRREEVLDVVLLEAHLERAVPAAQELLQGRALLLAVVEARPGLRDLLIHVVVLHAHQLGPRHASSTRPPVAAARLLLSQVLQVPQVSLSGERREAGPVWKGPLPVVKPSE